MRPLRRLQSVLSRALTDTARYDQPTALHWIILQNAALYCIAHICNPLPDWLGGGAHIWVAQAPLLKFGAVSAEYAQYVPNIGTYR
jgi:hypothetical protein